MFQNQLTFRNLENRQHARTPRRLNPRFYRRLTYWCLLNRQVVPNTNTSAQPPNQALNPPFPDPPSTRAEAADFRAEPPEHAPDSNNIKDRDEDVGKTKIATGCTHGTKKVGFFHTIGLFMVGRTVRRRKNGARGTRPSIIGTEED